MRGKNGIVVIGSVFVDIKGYPLAAYIPGGRNVGKVEQEHGGVSRNVAEDIANVELRPTFVSLVDDTGMGRDVLLKLRKHKINTEYIREIPNGMGTWLAVFNNDGDVAASISKRPDLSAILEILNERGDEMFREADSIAVEIDMDAAIIKKVLSLAQRYGREVYALVSNISIAMERRDLLRACGCFVCNLQEAGIFFSEDYTDVSSRQLQEELPGKIRGAGLRRMVVTMGAGGAVWAEDSGQSGFCPAIPVDVMDTTGAGDSFFAGVVIGLTYGKDMPESCAIGARLAASVIGSYENVCPRFQPEEFGLETFEAGE